MKLTKYHKQAIVNAIKADLPKIDYVQRKEKAQALIVKGMSRKAQALYKENANALAKAYINREYGLNDWGTLDMVVGDADWKTILKPFADETQVRRAAIDRLESAIEGCTTRKMFIDTFPEFSKYAPSEEGKTSNLPAIANVVGDLVKLGWKQTVSKGEAA